MHIWGAVALSYYEGDAPFYAHPQEGRGKKSNTAMEEPEVQIRHRMMPSDVPEHLMDLLLNHERPKMHAAPHEIDSSSSVTSASSASGIEIQVWLP
jgi:hypothetical protein